MWDKGNLNLSEAKKPEMLQGEYARTALRPACSSRARLGVNPYKFGMIGSTDTHTALATAEEENFFGKHSGTEPSAGARDAPGREVRRPAGHGLGAGGVRLRRRLGRARTRARRSSTP